KSMRIRSRSLPTMEGIPNRVPPLATPGTRGMTGFARAATGAVAALVSWSWVFCTAAGALPTPEQRCQSGTHPAAGRDAVCRQNAEAALVSSGNLTKYSTAILKCETKFANKWQKLIDHATAAGATCPDAPLTGAQFKTVIDEHSDNVTTGLNGGGLQDCPPALAQCQSDLAACLASTLPAVRVLKTGQTG